MQGGPAGTEHLLLALLRETDCVASQTALYPWDQHPEAVQCSALQLWDMKEIFKMTIWDQARPVPLVMDQPHLSLTSTAGI